MTRDRRNGSVRVESREEEKREQKPYPAGINPRESGLETLDFPRLFGNRNPVVLEIGSGKGRFLVTSALANPRHNYLGIEKSLHYHRVIESRIERRGLHNARVVNFDAALVLARMIPEGSIDEVYIYFPDPWPRPRERKRRIIRPSVVQDLQRVLRPGASGLYVTDHEEYFEKALPVLAMFFHIESEGEISGRQPRTNYEAKYLAQGRPIYEVVFGKTAEAGE